MAVTTRLRGGDRERERSYYSTRQRVVVLDFATPGEAAAFDQADPSERAAAVARLLSLPRVPSTFTCPECGMTSFHPQDAMEGYCGHCHEWTRKL